MKRTSVHCDKCGADITLEPLQSIYLGENKSYDLCLKCYNGIAEKIADVENEIIGDEEKPKACCECTYYNRDNQYWVDNSLVVTCGSCVKCKRNFVSTDPYNEVPSWCPLKGDEDERRKS